MRPLLKAALQVVLGVYSIGFAYVISRAPFPDNLLPLEILFFASVGVFFFIDTGIILKGILLSNGSEGSPA